MNVIGGAKRAVVGSIQPTSYKGKDRVPAIIALWLILVLLATARNGRLPDQKHVVALAVATLVVALAASVAPRVVFWVVLAGVVIVAVQNSDLIVRYVDAGSAKIQATLGGR